MMILRVVLALAVGLLLSSCSLLDVKIESNAVPLTQEELNLRLLSREYSATFFTVVEEAADAVAQENIDDNMIFSYSLLWKIHGEEGLQKACYQLSPMASLVDSWVFTVQMRDFWETGKGEGLLGESQNLAIDASQQLTAEIEGLAKMTMDSEEFLKAKVFVAQFAAANFFKGVVFNWTPSYREWLEYKGLDELEIATTLGTMSEALGDLSDRVTLVSQQVPKILSWKAELIARNSRINGEQLSQTLTNINNTSLKFQDFVENNPEYMRTLAVEMANELQPLLDELDKKAGEKLAVVSRERLALELMVERERAAIGEMITAERQGITRDVDTLVQNVVAKSIEQLTVMLKSILLYLIVLVFVIFFAPFGLGFFMGRRFKKNE